MRNLGVRQFTVTLAFFSAMLFLTVPFTLTPWICAATAFSDLNQLQRRLADVEDASQVRGPGSPLFTGQSTANTLPIITSNIASSLESSLVAIASGALEVFPSSNDLRETLGSTLPLAASTVVDGMNTALDALTVVQASALAALLETADDVTNATRESLQASLNVLLQFLPTDLLLDTLEGFVVGVRDGTLGLQLSGPFTNVGVPGGEFETSAGSTTQKPSYLGSTDDEAAVPDVPEETSDVAGEPLTLLLDDSSNTGAERHAGTDLRGVLGRGQEIFSQLRSVMSDLGISIFNQESAETALRLPAAILASAATAVQQRANQGLLSPVEAVRAPYADLLRPVVRLGMDTDKVVPVENVRVEARRLDQLDYGRRGSNRHSYLFYNALLSAVPEIEKNMLEDFSAVSIGIDVGYPLAYDGLNPGFSSEFETNPAVLLGDPAFAVADDDSYFLDELETLDLASLEGAAIKQAYLTGQDVVAAMLRQAPPHELPLGVSLDAVREHLDKRAAARSSFVPNPGTQLFDARAAPTSTAVKLISDLLILLGLLTTLDDSKPGDSKSGDNNLLLNDVFNHTSGFSSPTEERPMLRPQISEVPAVSLPNTEMITGPPGYPHAKLPSVRGDPLETAAIHIYTGLVINIITSSSDDETGDFSTDTFDESISLDDDDELINHMHLFNNGIENLLLYGYGGWQSSSDESTYVSLDSSDDYDYGMEFLVEDISFLFPHMELLAQQEELLRGPGTSTSTYGPHLAQSGRSIVQSEHGNGFVAAIDNAADNAVDGAPEDATEDATDDARHLSNSTAVADEVGLEPPGRKAILRAAGAVGRRKLMPVENENAIAANNLLREDPNISAGLIKDVVSTVRRHIGASRDSYDDVRPRRDSFDNDDNMGDKRDKQPTFSDDEIGGEGNNNDEDEAPDYEPTAEEKEWVDRDSDDRNRMRRELPGEFAENIALPGESRTTLDGETDALAETNKMSAPPEGTGTEISSDPDPEAPIENDTNASDTPKRNRGYDVVTDSSDADPLVDAAARAIMDSAAVEDATAKKMLTGLEKEFSEVVSPGDSTSTDANVSDVSPSNPPQLIDLSASVRGESSIRYMPTPQTTLATEAGIILGAGASEGWDAVLAPLTSLAHGVSNVWWKLMHPLQTMRQMVDLDGSPAINAIPQPARIATASISKGL